LVLYRVNVTDPVDEPGFTTANPVEARSAGENSRGKYSVD
jgi:hypothetical protein